VRVIKFTKQTFSQLKLAPSSQTADSLYVAILIVGFEGLANQVTDLLTIFKGYCPSSEFFSFLPSQELCLPFIESEIL
jgi:hypothetical protein